MNTRVRVPFAEIVGGIAWKLLNIRISITEREVERSIFIRNSGVAHLYRDCCRPGYAKRPSCLQGQYSLVKFGRLSLESVATCGDGSPGVVPLLPCANRMTEFIRGHHCRRFSTSHLLFYKLHEHGNSGERSGSPCSRIEIGSRRED